MMKNKSNQRKKYPQYTKYTKLRQKHHHHPKATAHQRWVHDTPASEPSAESFWTGSESRPPLLGDADIPAGWFKNVHPPRAGNYDKG